LDADYPSEGVKIARRITDKLCMELVGLPSSRCRSPTRDIREKYRERARAMLIEAGTPNVIGA
jgi:hypothetical protein